MSDLHSIAFVLFLLGFGLLCLSAGFYGATWHFVGWSRRLFLLAIACFVIGGLAYLLWVRLITYRQFAAISALLCVGSFGLGYSIGRRP